MKTKIKKGSQRCNRFGGLNFVIPATNKKKVPELIDEVLGKRVKQARYKYSDILLSLMYAPLCGGQRLEDAHALKPSFQLTDHSNFPSPDRLSFMLKKLSVPSIIYQGAKPEVVHEFNVNMKMNHLMVDLALRLGVVSPEKNNVLDYDNHIIENKKKDSTHTYGNKHGYQPGVAMINKVPVYIEGRSGRSNASYLINETIGRAMELLNEKKVKVTKFRSDAAGYNERVIRMMVDRGIEFFIRSNNSQALYRTLLNDEVKWQAVKLKDVDLECTSIYFKPFKADTAYRYVFTRRPRGVHGRRNKYLGDFKTYRAIITNNTTMTDKEVTQFYNDRGSIEQNFSEYNKFNWCRLPFSLLKHNTVFMIVMGMACTLYQYLLTTFKAYLPFLKGVEELKAFKRMVMQIVTLWVYGQQTRTLEILSKCSMKDFEKLMVSLE